MSDNVIRHLLKPVNPIFMLLQSILTILWGMWAINPWTSAFNNKILYTFLASIAPEWAWGLFAILIGVVVIFGVLKGSKLWIVRGSFLQMAFWTFISVLYFSAQWWSFAGLYALTYAFYSGFIYVNMNVNRKHCANNKRDKV